VDLKIGRAQPDDPLEHGAAYVGDDALSDPGDEVKAAERRTGEQDDDADKEKNSAVERRRVAAPEPVINEPAQPLTEAQTLHEIAGSDPEALEPAQRGIGALEILPGKPSLRQHLAMALMHRRQAVPQSDPLLGEPDANHASIMQRTLLREIAVLDHLFDIVRNVRSPDNNRVMSSLTFI